MDIEKITTQLLSSRDINEKVYDELLEQLSNVISQLLNSDMDKLMSLMYRLDIDEVQFKEAVNSEKPSYRIAQLVINRQIEKNKYRNLYK